MSNREDPQLYFSCRLQEVIGQRRESESSVEVECPLSSSYAYPVSQPSYFLADSSENSRKHTPDLELETAVFASDLHIQTPEEPLENTLGKQTADPDKLVEELLKAMAEQKKELQEVKQRLKKRCKEKDELIVKLSGELEHYVDKTKKLQEERKQFYTMFAKLEQRHNELTHRPSKHIKTLKIENETLKQQLREVTKKPSPQDPEGVLVCNLVEVLGVKRPKDVLKRVTTLLKQVRRHEWFVSHVVDLATSKAPPKYFEEKVCLRRVYKWLASAL